MAEEEVKEEIKEDIPAVKPEPVIEKPEAIVKPVKPADDRKAKEAALAAAVKAEEASRLTRIKANKEAAEAKSHARATAKMERLVCGYSDRVLRGQAKKAEGDYKVMIDKELKRRDQK